MTANPLITTLQLKRQQLQSMIRRQNANLFLASQQESKNLLNIVVDISVQSPKRLKVSKTVKQNSAILIKKEATTTTAVMKKVR